MTLLDQETTFGWKGADVQLSVIGVGLKIETMLMDFQTKGKHEDGEKKRAKERNPTFSDWPALWRPVSGRAMDSPWCLKPSPYVMTSSSLQDCYEKPVKRSCEEIYNV